MLTTAERTFVLHHLDASAQGFTTRLQSCNPNLWSSRPDSDSWSVAECAEHVAVVEARVATLCKTLRNIEIEYFDPEKYERKTKLVLSIKHRGSRVAAPQPIHPHGRFASAQACLDSFVESRNAIISLINSDINDDATLLRGRFSAHPFLGKLDGYQWILSASAHTERHSVQIEEIIALAS